MIEDLVVFSVPFFFEKKISLASSKLIILKKSIAEKDISKKN